MEPSAAISQSSRGLEPSAAVSQLSRVLEPSAAISQSSRVLEALGGGQPAQPRGRRSAPVRSGVS